MEEGAEGRPYFVVVELRVVGYLFGGDDPQQVVRPGRRGEVEEEPRALKIRQFR